MQKVTNIEDARKSIEVSNKVYGSIYKYSRELTKSILDAKELPIENKYLYKMLSRAVGHLGVSLSSASDDLIQKSNDIMEEVQDLLILVNICKYYQEVVKTIDERGGIKKMTMGQVT